MIYTKKGDNGTTSLVGGKRVNKFDLRVESYGTLDELNSHIGLVRDLIIKREKKAGRSKIEAENNTNAKYLLVVINSMFKLQTIIASLPEDKEDAEKIFDNVWKDFQIDIKDLEERIDTMEQKLPKLKNFILPTGYYISSHTHVARTICRRAERLLSKLNNEQFVSEKSLIYINRLSDYLFCLSRYIMKDYKYDEIYLQG
ncbi:MAG: cob(I)yrinic acid a,c-diamide adenosyltransferase [Bacteroidales bacterium]|jgi:cob(I)alamin adenosyltransferase|nr:cob(I)yrinic acid a,c-diamide adenosyltransferase [Bacteroidales bacterium]